MASTSLGLLDDPMPENHSLPAFMVSTQRGFLPRADPIVSLPSEFAQLESLLDRMPVKTASGAPGLLASFQLGEAVRRELPDLSDCITPLAADLPLINALYRDYSFLASAYLLEPCHERYVKGQQYGLARHVLPAAIAKPIVRCADM
jgi:indoleamine 2,3-dioxygenase